MGIVRSYLRAWIVLHVRLTFPATKSNTFTHDPTAPTRCCLIHSPVPVASPRCLAPSSVPKILGSFTLVAPSHPRQRHMRSCQLNTTSPNAPFSFFVCLCLTPLSCKSWMGTRCVVISIIVVLPSEFTSDDPGFLVGGQHCPLLLLVSTDPFPPTVPSPGDFPPGSQISWAPFSGSLCGGALRSLFCSASCPHPRLPSSGVPCMARRLRACPFVAAHQALALPLMAASCSCIRPFHSGLLAAAPQVCACLLTPVFPAHALPHHTLRAPMLCAPQ